jgi:septal ring factor EnvC (AmiA/AmiB activator)
MNRFIRIQSIVLFLLLSFVSPSNAKNEQANQEISNRIILEKLELYQSVNNTKFELIIQQMNKGFEQIDKRFLLIEKRMTQVEKRIAQVEKHIAQVEKRIEMIERRVLVMENRLDQIDKRFERIDKRFEQLYAHMNKRFDQVDKRLSFLELLYIALLAATIGTPVIIEIRREKKMMKMTKENHDVKKLVETFRELAKKDENVRSVLKTIDDKYFFYGYN